MSWHDPCSAMPPPCLGLPVPPPLVPGGCRQEYVKQLDGIKAQRDALAASVAQKRSTGAHGCWLRGCGSLCWLLRCCLVAPFLDPPPHPPAPPTTHPRSFRLPPLAPPPPLACSDGNGGRDRQAAGGGSGSGATIRPQTSGRSSGRSSRGGGAAARGSGGSRAAATAAGGRRCHAGGVSERRAASGGRWTPQHAALQHIMLSLCCNCVPLL